MPSKSKRVARKSKFGTMPSRRLKKKVRALQKARREARVSARHRASPEPKRPRRPATP
jgi:hypothetical protein